jgi:NTP pyrophosphatase (non-canonical NTP hydrolase)
MEATISKGKYKIYHIPGVKVGCTSNIQKRVIEAQGYKNGEYEILFETDDVAEASKVERTLQEDLGYKIDRRPYKDLFKKTMNKHSSSAATTTFKISSKELDTAFLADLEIKTQYGTFKLDSTDKIDWVISNVHNSQFGPNSCYIYNKAMAEAGEFQKLSEEKLYSHNDQFELIREWAKIRGIYDKGDAKTQLIKLYEESGELSQAILKNDKEGIIDAIGDSVVVLTNLAHLVGVNIEDCIQSAYDEISNRTGRMINGTFVKDA